MSVRFIDIKPMPAAVVEYKASMDTIGREMGEAFSEVVRALAKLGVQPGGMPFSFYPEEPGDRSKSVRVISGLPVPTPIPEINGVRNFVLPGGRVAMASHVGPYESLEQTYRQMGTEIKKAGLRPGSMMWEYYFTDPRSEPDESRWRTDIYWPVLSNF